MNTYGSTHRRAFSLDSPFRRDLVVKGGAPLAAYHVRRPTVDIDLAAVALGNEADIVATMVVATAATRPRRTCCARASNVVSPKAI